MADNARVKAGLTPDGVQWAFTTGEGANCHTLTWLSHMLDVTLFGLAPGGHHLTSILLHILDALLLFLVLDRMTGAVWRSGFVGALFAVHPLHVESVAWIAERKDVLSTLLWILTMGAYALWVERPTAARHALGLVFFALGLMAKPMLVTIPFVLLLLDWWPLGRLELAVAPLSRPWAARATAGHMGAGRWAGTGTNGDDTVGARQRGHGGGGRFRSGHVSPGGLGKERTQHRLYHGRGPGLAALALEKWPFSPSPQCSVSSRSSPSAAAELSPPRSSTPLTAASRTPSSPTCATS